METPYFVFQDSSLFRHFHGLKSEWQIEFGHYPLQCVLSVQQPSPFLKGMELVCYFMREGKLRMIKTTFTADIVSWGCLWLGCELLFKSIRADPEDKTRISEDWIIENFIQRSEKVVEVIYSFRGEVEDGLFPPEYLGIEEVSDKFFLSYMLCGRELKVWREQCIAVGTPFATNITSARDISGLVSWCISMSMTKRH